MRILFDKGIKDKAHSGTGASDIVNMRCEDGVWVDANVAKRVRELFAYGKDWHLHKVGGELWYWCFYEQVGYVLSWREGMVGARIMCRGIGDVYSYANTGNAVVVSTDKGGFTFVYDKDKGLYDMVGALPALRLKVTDIESETVSDWGLDFTGVDNHITYLFSKIKEKHNTFYAQGKTQGHTLFLVAYKTVYGDLVGCSPLYYKYVGAIEKDNENGAEICKMISSFIYSLSPAHISDTRLNISGYHCKSNIKVGINGVDSLKDSHNGIIDSVCVFASKPVADVDYDCTVDDLVKVETSSAFDHAFVLPNSDFKIDDVAGMYCVQEIKLDDLKGWQTYDVSLCGIEANEAMGVISAGHNESGRVLGVYNNRLHSANVHTILADSGNVGIDVGANGYELPHGLKHSDCVVSTRDDIFAYVYLKTEQGDKRVLSQMQGEWGVYTGDKLVLSSVISYHDSRAYGLRVLRYTNGVYYDMSGLLPMKAHPFLNTSIYSKRVKMVGSLDVYGHLCNVYDSYFRIYRGEELDLNGGAAFDVEEDRRYSEPNRLQVYASGGGLLGGRAKWSYRFGGSDCEVRGMGANVISLGASQFGHHPMMVMCSDGVYALSHGNGEVLYSTVVPVGYDVMISGDVLPTRYGLVFRAERGLLLQSGKDAVVLSEDIDGVFENALGGVDIFDNQVNGASGVSNVSDALFRDGSSYLRLVGDRYGYCYKRNELYVNVRDEDDDNRNYCLVYNMRHKVWSKLRGRYDSFYYLDGVLYGVRGRIVYDLSGVGECNENGFVYVSSAIRLDVDEQKLYKVRLLYRDLFPNGNIQGHKLSFQLWGSRSGRQYKMIAGSRFRQTGYIELRNVKVSNTFYKFVVAAKHRNVQLIGAEVDLSFRYR